MSTPTPLSTLIPQSEYIPVIEDLIACLTTGFRTNLHSVYVYGSVAQGRAIPNVSNLDVVVVTRESCKDSQSSLFNTINWRFQREFAFVRGLSIRTAQVAEVASLDALFTWGFLLKQCCVNVMGDDLAECFGEYVPSWEIAKQWNMDIGQTALQHRQQVALADSQQEILVSQRQMAKKLLRASYGLVMHKTRRWLDDPVACGQQFLTVYPERAQTIERLEILLGTRAIPKRSVVALVDEFGPWLAKEYQKLDFKIG